MKQRKPAEPVQQGGLSAGKSWIDTGGCSGLGGSGMATSFPSSSISASACSSGQNSPVCGGSADCSWSSSARPPCHSPSKVKLLHSRRLHNSGGCWLPCKPCPRRLQIDWVVQPNFTHGSPSTLTRYSIATRCFESLRNQVKASLDKEREVPSATKSGALLIGSLCTVY